MWRNQSLKTVFEFEYFKLQSYLHDLNEISLADRSMFSSKLDTLRSNLNDHANKLIQRDKSLQKWKQLAEKSNIEFDDLHNYNSSGFQIRDFCF